MIRRLIKRPAIIAQFFYHTARILLARTHPMESDFHMEMKEMQQAHAHDICGLAANTKDRGLANISIRCLAIASMCLESREAQEEALRILNSTAKDTIWQAENIENDLQRHWNWPPLHPDTVDPTQMHNNHYYEVDHQLSISKTPGISPQFSNPLLGMGDFSAETHPYQGFYITPNHTLDQYQYGNYLL